MIITMRSVSEPRTYATASASADRDDRLEHEQRHEHRQRRPEARRQDVRHRLVRAPRRAEVGGQDLLEENPELDVIRLVDAQLAADVVDLLGIGDLAGEHVRRVAAEQVEQDEHQQHHADHRREHLPEPAEHISPHRRFLSRPRGSHAGPFALRARRRRAALRAPRRPRPVMLATGRGAVCCLSTGRRSARGGRAPSPLLLNPLPFRT